MPPLAVARNAAGTSDPTGANRIAASSGCGDGTVESPGPASPEPPREFLRLKVSRTREREHLPPLIAGDLRNDVRGSAKTINAEALGVTRHDESAVPDQPRAEQRRRFGIAITIRQGKTVTAVSDDIFGIAAASVDTR
jgi:hypothetical protein